MTTRVDSWNNGYQPADSVWRTADFTVLFLVVIALLGGALLRQANFNATTETSTNGVTFNIPRGAYSRTEGETYIATTPEGFSVRVQTLDVPPIGAEDAAALAATRAIQLAQGRDMFQSVGTEAVQAAGRAGAVMEYQYVENNNDQLFSNTLQVVNGYELLVAHEGRLYAISLEGPSDKRAELDALWSQIQSSVRFGG